MMAIHRQACLLCLASSVLGAAAAAAPSVRIVAEHQAPDVLRHCGDVRWLGERSVALALGTHGTFELQLSPPYEPKLLAPASGEKLPGVGGASGSKLLRAHTRLAVSNVGIAVADSIFGLSWMPHRGADPPAILPIHYCYDLDLHGSRVLLTGVPSVDAVQKHGFAVAWEADLNRAPLRFEPRHLLAERRWGSSQEFIQITDWQLNSSAAHARFLPDGSLAVLPGVEPGAFLYGPDLRLRRAWDQEVLGTNVAWGTAAEGRRIHLHPEERITWPNTKRLAEVMLPLPEGPALLVREVQQRRTRWTLVLLREDGSSQRVELPLSTTGPYWHVAADARGHRIILCVRDACVLDNPSPCGAPRLLELEVQP